MRVGPIAAVFAVAGAFVAVAVAVVVVEKEPPAAGDHLNSVPAETEP